MPIISQANLRTLTDHLANIWDLLKPKAGEVADVAAPVAGTAQYAADAAQDLITSIGDYEPIRDMAQQMYNLARGMNVEGILGGSGITTTMKAAVSAINSHAAALGSSVDSSVTNLTSLMVYANTTRFTSMLAPTFGDLWYALFGTRLTPYGLLSPAIHPTWNADVSAEGMGSRAYGGSFTAGTAMDNTLHSEVEPLVEVVTSFANGTTPPQVTIAGTDHTGNTATTWSVTFGDTDPSAAVSTTTTEAITAQARQTITLDDATGIIVGSVLTINSGDVDEEVVIVETVASDDITAVFLKAHDSGAAVTGNLTVATTPSVAGRRLRSVSGITLTLDTHDAGKIRVVGKQDRVPV